MAVIIKLKPKNDGGPVSPSYDDALKASKALAMASHPDQIEAVLKTIVLGQFKQLQRETLIQAVHYETKLPKRSLRRQLQVIEQELGLLPNDFALEVARTVRNQHFNNGAHLLRSVDGSYLRFVGTHWEVTNRGELRKLLLEEANAVLHLYDGSNLSTLVNQAWACLNDLLGTDQDVLNLLDDPPAVINVENGEIWMGEDGSFTRTPHRPESRITYCLPLEYDPNAECPKYDQALVEIFSKSSDPKGMVRHFHEFVGYCIQPNRNLPSYWLLIGHGANGKTSLLQTLQRLLGPNAVINDSVARFMRDRFNTAYLQGKLLFVDDDMSEDAELDDGLLKQISENKRISARRAYGHQKVDFVCRAMPVMAGNNYPVIKDVSKGMWRRAKVIPFDRVFGKDEADLKLFPTIWKREMPGVLNRALEGLQRLRKRGDFKLPTDCERALAEFFCHANPLMGFIKDRCVVDPEARARLCDFRQAMKVWAREQGLRGVPADNTLKRKLQGLEFEVKLVNGYNKVFGVAPKP